MKNRKVYLILLLFIFLQSWISAQSSDAILNQVKNQEAFQDAELSIFVKNLSTAETIIDYQKEKLRTPASILKVRTAIQAYKHFGRDHTFKTSVYLVGKISDGILYGDIVIKGYGDPTLGSDLTGAVQLNDMISDLYAQLREKNISCVFGSIVADASMFSLPGVPAGYMHEDIANYYGAGAYGINIQDNAYEISFSRIGKSAVKIATFDSLAIQEVTHEVTAEGRSDQAYIFDHPNENQVHVVGKIPAGTGRFKIKGAIKNPPKYVATYVQQALEKSDIEFQENVLVKFYPHAINNSILWAKDYFSPPLHEILIPVLHKSNNVYAEVLYRHLNKANAWSTSEHSKLVDGSGLSPGNRVSAEDLMTDLLDLTSSEHTDDILSLLPQNGKHGTVRSILTDNPGALYIKSGSIGGVRCYIGLRKSKQDDLIGFVCMANELTASGYQSRKAWETLLAHLAKM